MFPRRIPRSAQSSCLNTRAREGTRERVKGARGERGARDHEVRPSVSPSIIPSSVRPGEREMAINYGDGRHRAALEQKCERGREGGQGSLLQSFEMSSPLNPSE